MINGFSRFKEKLAGGLSASLMIWSDSTGYYKTGEGLNCWPYLLAESIAVANPSYTVIVKRFNANTLAYDAPTTIQTGSGGTPPVVTLWNFAIVGVATYFALGSNWSFLQQPVDGLLINHGHNHYAGSPYHIRGEFLVAVEMYRATYPSTPITAMIQNPWRTSSFYGPIKSAWLDTGSLRGVPLVNVHDAFVDAGKPNSWYVNGSDEIHPSQLGQDQWFALLWQHYLDATAVNSSTTSTLLNPPTQNPNLIPAIDSGAWVSAGNGTLSVSTDRGRYDPARGFSRKLTSTGGESWLQYTLPADVLALVRGQDVTFSARSWIDSGSNSTLRVSMIDIDGTTYFSRPYNRGWDGWAWWSLSGVAVPSNAGSLKLRLYHDWSSSPQSKPVYFDQASFNLGKVPYAARVIDKASMRGINR